MLSIAHTRVYSPGFRVRAGSRRPVHTPAFSAAIDAAQARFPFVSYNATTTCLPSRGTTMMIETQLTAARKGRVNVNAESFPSPGEVQVPIVGGQWITPA